MNLNIAQTGIQKANDIKIPEIFFQRFSSGISAVDEVFSGGFIPSQVFVLSAVAGSGKTTIALQILDALQSQGKRVAYLSGEETIFQLAFTCKRLNINPPLTNMSNIDEIGELIKKESLDFVILDSIPSMTTNVKMNSNQRDEYLSNKIVEIAKETNCVIGCILHVTKNGTYRGSTKIVHAVDSVLHMIKSETVKNIRTVEVEKNRFGATIDVDFKMTVNGFDFSYVAQTVVSAPTKKETFDLITTEVLKFMRSNRNTIQACYFNKFGIDPAMIKSALTSLAKAGMVSKMGSGKNVQYLLKSTELDATKTLAANSMSTVLSYRVENLVA